ncbi:MAG TPA: hypothetical protein DEQ40_07945, partial [Oxalobacteraceae bacterium]|nr:hypothetical protein [Oxalobacteraceae bacterium]
ANKVTERIGLRYAGNETKAERANEVADAMRDIKHDVLPATMNRMIDSIGRANICAICMHRLRGSVTQRNATRRNATRVVLMDHNGKVYHAGSKAHDL